MAGETKRLTVGGAAELIMQKLHIPPGPSLLLLIEAKGSGEVQTFGDAGSEWWKIDAETELVTDTSGVYKMAVTIDSDDLNYWLDRNLDRLIQQYRPAVTRDPIKTEPQSPEAPRGNGAARNAEAPPPRVRVGRKPGSGSKDDDSALRQMLSLFASGKAPSVLAAARSVAAAGTPNQSVRADVDRLRRKFAKRWSTNPPQGKPGPTLLVNWTRIESE